MCIFLATGRISVPHLHNDVPKHLQSVCECPKAAGCGFVPSRPLRAQAAGLKPKHIRYSSAGIGPFAGTSSLSPKSDGLQPSDCPRFCSKSTVLRPSLLSKIENRPQIKNTEQSWSEAEHQALPSNRIIQVSRGMKTMKLSNQQKYVQKPTSLPGTPD